MNIIEALKQKKMMNMDSEENSDESSMDNYDSENPNEGTKVIDPRSMSKNGETIYIAKTMFPGGCKQGDKVCITATISKQGDKYGVIPEEIVKESPNGESNEEGMD